MCELIFVLVPLTLIDVKEGLTELVGEKGLGEVPEELFHHICHIISRLVFITDVLRKVLIHLTQGMNSRLYSRLAKKTHLKRVTRTY